MHQSNNNDKIIVVDGGVNPQAQLILTRLLDSNILILRRGSFPPGLVSAVHSLTVELSSVFENLGK